MNGTIEKSVTLTNGIVTNHNVTSNNNVYPPTQQQNSRPTLGRHVARRLVEAGVRDVFAVPGDFNLVLLDNFVAEPGLNLIGCCNELNAGYAADGYARARGVAAVAVTFTVGGLSLVNAIAGAYSEDLPVICIVGGPNSNDYGANKIVHHTIGLPDFSQELLCFQPITCHQAVINDLENAQEQIDEAISAALRESKPVYINISCNLPSIPYPSFTSLPFFMSPRLSNQMALEHAVEVAADLLNKAAKSVMIGGPKLRPAKATREFIEFANSSGYAVAVMPSGKGLVPENHPRFIGTYWGTVSSPFCLETVESADAYLFAGPEFNDITTVGYSLSLKREKMVVAQPRSVTIGNGPTIGNVNLKDFLKALAKRVKHNETAYEGYKIVYMTKGLFPVIKSNPNEALKVNVLFKHVQNMLSSETILVAESGIPWFTCQTLKLPEGCGFEIQLQYGSIGWSFGATLGYAKAVPNKRLICCVGDGSFQMVAQEVSTMLSCGQNNIIILINNGGYSVEVAIHDGPYNVIRNWDYTALVDAIHNGQGKCWTTKVTCEKQLVAAIDKAMGEKKECLCFIEVFVHKHDTGKELIEFCSTFCVARPPKHVS